MPEFLFEVTSFLFFVFLILNILSWLYLWEDKGNSWRRLIIYLRDTKEGRGIVVGPLNILKWAIIFSYGCTVFISGIDIYFYFSVFLLYIILIGNLIRRAYLRRFEFPKFRFSTLFLLSLILFFEIFLYVFPPLDKFLWLLILDKLLPLFVIFSTIFASVFFDFSQDVIINRAINKISKHNNLLTVTVVGSYGKGSTKEFISRILKLKYNVLTTKNSFNSSIGIAKTINSALTNKKQIFIAEMEDYRKGDIAEMSRIINPKIVVVTGVNDRNVSLFGSVNKVMDSKFEAIENLPRDGVVVFNGTEKNTMALYKKTKTKKLTYSRVNKKSDIFITKMTEEKFQTSLELSIMGKRYSVKNIKLIGINTIESLLPGILLGFFMGVDFVLIKKVLKEATPLSHTMKPILMKKGTVIIDDTFNVTINSIEQIVDYVKKYRGKKILVLEPLTDLGSNSKKDYRIIGKKISKAFDVVFLTNSNFKNDIVKSIRDYNNRVNVLVASTPTIVEFINKKCSKNDIVILEGREAGKVLSLISDGEIDAL